MILQAEYGLCEPMDWLGHYVIFVLFPKTFDTTVIKIMVSDRITPIYLK